MKLKSSQTFKLEWKKKIFPEPSRVSFSLSTVNMAAILLGYTLHCRVLVNYLQLGTQMLSQYHLSLGSVLTRALDTEKSENRNENVQFHNKKMEAERFHCRSSTD